MGVCICPFADRQWWYLKVKKKRVLSCPQFGKEKWSQLNNYLFDDTIEK